MDTAQREFLNSLIDAPSRRATSNRCAASIASTPKALPTACARMCMATSSPAATRRASRVSCLPGIATSWASRSTTSRSEGFIYFNTIGGHDAGVVPGRRVVVHTRNGPVPGVTGRRAIHLTPLDERGKPAKIEDIWIDIAVADKDEAESLVRVGDPITYDVGIQDLRNGVVAGRALDNKVGALGCRRGASPD